MKKPVGTNGPTIPAGSAESQARLVALRLLARMIARAHATASLPHETEAGIDGAAGIRNETTTATFQDGDPQQ
ncbi:hypothetical protein ACFLXE_03510 [Chloroflexota bacterium]